MGRNKGSNWMLGMNRESNWNLRDNWSIRGYWNRVGICQIRPTILVFLEEVYI